MEINNSIFFEKSFTQVPYDMSLASDPAFGNINNNVKLDQFNMLSKEDLDYTNNELRKVDDRVSKLEDKIDKMIRNQKKLIKDLDYLVERKAKVKNFQYDLRG